jgi:O-antigen/teichoic acid export membrane protein
LPVDFLLPIVGLGVPQTIYFLLPKSRNKKKLLLDSLFLVLIPCLLFFIFINLGGSNLISSFFNNPNLKTTLFWSSIMLIVHTPVQILLSVLIFEGKTKQVTLISSLVSICFAAVVVFLIKSDTSLNNLIIVKSTAPILYFVFYFTVIFKFYSKEKLEITTEKRIARIKDITKVSVPFALASVFNIISLQIDKLIVSLNSSPEVFAVYANGAIEVPFISVITGAIASVMVSHMSKEIDAGRKENAYYYFKKAATYSAFILFPVMILFLINAKPFMVLLYSSKYVDSSIPFTIYLFFLPIRIVVFGSAYVAAGQSKLILKRAVIEMFLNVILSLILFKIIGVWGVAISSILVVYFWSVPYNLIKLSSIYNVKYTEMFEYAKLLKIMMISLLFSPIIYFIQQINIDSIYQIIVSTFIYLFVLSVVYIKFNLFIISDLKKINKV